MAQASRVFDSYDSAYATDCETRAINAWTWAQSNPSITAPGDSDNNANGGSGAYGDTNYDDEFLWAACELYLATDNATYKTYIDSHIGSYSMGSIANWGEVKNLGMFSLAAAGSGSYQSSSQTAITNYADTILSQISSNPYAIPMLDNDFVWGSNGAIGNYGVVLAYAYYLTTESKYLKGVAQVANYLLGKNATGYSFISGYGNTQVMNPHHRPSRADGIANPVPGMVAGGPNPGGGFEVDNYPSSLPAKSYIDDAEAYACNEVAINWNAPAVFIFYTLDNNKTGFNI